MTLPKIQIKAAAGLGKTHAVIEEIMARPALWSLHVSIYVPTKDLAEELAGKFGPGPRVVVMQGRNSKNCGKARVRMIERAMELEATRSVYKAFCHSDFSKCPRFRECDYLKQFDPAPAVRIYSHFYLRAPTPPELNLPPPDVVIIDESIITTMTGHAAVEIEAFRDPRSFNGIDDAEIIADALVTGAKVADAITRHPNAMITALRTEGVAPGDLRAAAMVARVSADCAKLRPDMPLERMRSLLQGWSPKQAGRVVRVLDQLARDMAAGKETSIGVEFDPRFPSKAENGEIMFCPRIRVHFRHECTIPDRTAVVMIDADALIDVNDVLLGRRLRPFVIQAKRRGRFIQAVDTTLPKSTLMHARTGANLRQRIQSFAARKVTEGQLVLAVTNLPVRLAFTDELEPDAYTRWAGGEMTHYGRTLGVNRWSNFTMVVIIGREQMPAADAERMARAVWADSAEPLALPGAYTKAARAITMRDGTSGAIQVDIHPDPRVQAMVEVVRECGIAQAIDRIRLIHHDERDPEVVILTNIPVPGVIVDELRPLDEILAGGSVIEQAMAEIGLGVLPLQAEWLCVRMPHLFPSLRTAERIVAETNRQMAYRSPSGYNQTNRQHAYINIGEVAEWVVTKGKRPSTAIIAHGHPAPREALETLVGQRLYRFGSRPD
ncbi:hypothetical protein WV31_14495 [Magnetospirillum sp. ME-1]|nr:hypothetical protein WV31_14495 [Magnetospirillum sp. ME-1]